MVSFAQVHVFKCIFSSQGDNITLFFGFKITVPQTPHVCAGAHTGCVLGPLQNGYFTQPEGVQVKILSERQTHLSCLSTKERSI